MDRALLEKNIDTLLNDLKVCFESRPLTENDSYLLKAEIDRIIYECMYYKTKFVS